MTPSAVFFGAIGTLAETSDMQRRAFNAAFEEAGLGWRWDPGAYRDMLRAPGGRARIARFAKERGESVDADALHARKVAHFRALVEEEGIAARPGVVALIETARERGIKVGFVTATGEDTVDLILRGLEGCVARDRFALVTHGGLVPAGKPDPAIYVHALAALGLDPKSVLAIEDTPESAQAAVAAGIPTIACPGLEAQGRDSPGVEAVVDALDPGLLDGRAGRAA
ncbi:HAD-IA family hydrolase [Cognatishimia sp. F0-27]|uniref:HAD-IA family hydrolase n=1 Tax=Cognatishimia sp. F0-27 TaxID=2816855 RepID=UPI001D0C93A2|nr:HAD-IA family hydrolase [Cognatishimia sp. F0-27]MCC1494241.1 HAD-IA family hydrolase [Cognatishimia sp. F0-27]